MDHCPACFHAGCKQSATAMRSMRNGRPTARSGRMMFIVLALLAIFAGGGYGAYRYFAPGSGDEVAGPLLQKVVRGPFDHIVLEQGEVESSSNIDVLCEVKTRGSSGTPILWVIDEGTYVKKGDKLVELDSSGLETELQAQRILVASAEATVISSKAAVRTAEIALEEYIRGTYQTERRAILSEIALAEQEMRKMELNLASAERLAAKGMVKSLQIEAEKFAVSNAKNMLDSATGRLKVLDELTQEKMKVQLESAIDAAKAKLSSDESVLNEELNKLREAEDQVAKCIIKSPADGVVVHNNVFSGRGGAEFVVEAGASVRERQCIIKLPDPNRMQVKAKINESRITLIREGMPVRISITAAQDELKGRVRRVNKYAEPGSWFSSSVKEYATFIEILDPPESIRTGMTAEVRIFVEQLDDALQIPVQGIYEYKGHHFCLKRDGDGWATSEIKIGATNDKMVTIEEGLAEGDEIALNPRSRLDLMVLPEIEDVPDRDELQKMASQPMPASNDSGSGSSGGGGFSPDAAADRMMSAGDKNNDGKLTSDELNGLDERMRDRAKQADANRDGTVDRAELVAALKKRAAQSGGGGQGGPGGPGGPGGLVVLVAAVQVDLVAVDRDRWRRWTWWRARHGRSRCWWTWWRWWRCWRRWSRRSRRSPRRSWSSVMKLACSVRELKKEYVLKGETVRALRGVSFDVPEGDYVAIMGPSGSGKSTLLNMLGCLDKPTSGGLYLGEDNVAQMTDDQLAEIRSRRIGFVFQAYNLIQQLTVVENIQVPLYYQVAWVRKNINVAANWQPWWD